MSFAEPVLFGFPLHLLVLYFLIYACLGWGMETAYCSITEKKFMVRGFLYGPVCPIYGVGVLMMICWFAPLTGSPVVFYLAATVCMSAWEYFVGWFLEVTTHIKYWDYSMFKFNLHGRICLWVCLMWGVLAYIVIFWIHPFVSGLVLLAPVLARQLVALVLLCALLVDAGFTIRDLALMSTALAKLNQTGEELRLQLSLGKAELGDRLAAAMEAAPDSPGEAAEMLKASYDELLAKAERQTRRFRDHYRHMSSQSLSQSLSEVAEAGGQLKARLQEAGAQRKAERQAQKAAKKAARAAK